MQLAAAIIVGFVWIQIGFSFFSFMILYAPVMLAHNPTLFWIIIPIFLIFVCLLCISYFRSTYTNPGFTRPQINQLYISRMNELKAYAKQQIQRKKNRRGIQHQSQLILADQIQSLRRVSYCQKCDIVKQIRVHHCSLCDKCVSRMDHHCPYIGNCVGKYNHKYFILFLFYATISLMIVSMCLVIQYLHTCAQFQNMSQNSKIILLIVGISSLFQTLSIGFLFITQVLSSLANLTTLQTFIIGIEEYNPFDRGSNWENLQQIFGESCWLFPTTPIFKEDNKLGYQFNQQLF